MSAFNRRLRPRCSHSARPIQAFAYAGSGRSGQRLRFGRPQGLLSTPKRSPDQIAWMSASSGKRSLRSIAANDGIALEAEVQMLARNGYRVKGRLIEEHHVPLGHGDGISGDAGWA